MQPPAANAEARVVDLVGTITVSDERSLASLVSLLAGCGCDVELTGSRRLRFGLHWGGPGHDVSLANAWREVVFFLRTWEQERDVACEVRELAFAPGRSRLVAAA